MARYTVQAPDGSTIELEGPDGASQDDVIAQAQRLYAERQAAPAAPRPRPIASFQRGVSPEDAVAAQASRLMQAQPEFAPPPRQAPEPGLGARLQEAFTGAARTTPEIEALPDIGKMPERNQFSVSGLKAAFGQIAASGPEELVQVIGANFPDVQARVDAKGNYILRSGIDGKEYAIKPGFQASDVAPAIGKAIPQIAASQLVAPAAAAMGLGRAAQLASALMTAGVVQTATEEVSAMAGGTVEPVEVGKAIAGEAFGQGVGAAIGKGVSLAKGGVRAAKQAVRRAAPQAAEQTVGQVLDVATTPAAQAAGAAPIPGAQAAPASAAAAAPAAPAAAQGFMDPAELSDLVRKASRGGLGSAEAKRTLAEIAQFNPQAKADAEALGFELPFDVFADNPQIRAASGLLRSKAASAEEAAYTETLKKAVSRADELMSEYGATFMAGKPAAADVSDRVLSSMTNMSKELGDQAGRAFKEFDARVPKNTKITLPGLAAKLDEVMSTILPSQMTKAERGLSRLVKKDKDGNLLEVPYGAFLREKQEMFEQMEKRIGNKYKDVNQRQLEDYYDIFRKEQLDLGARLGDPDASGYIADANLLWAKKKDVDKVITEGYGDAADNSIAKLMKSALRGAVEGDRKEWNKLARVLDGVPRDLQRETVATALASAARTSRKIEGLDPGAFGFAEYAKLYQGLRANPPVYKRIVDALGPGSDESLQKLFEVSKRVTDARSRVLGTGKANQEFIDRLNAEGFVGKVLDASLRTGTGKVATAALGGTLGGGVGAAAAAAIVGAAGGKKSGQQAASQFFASGEFKQLLTEAAVREVRPELIRRVAASSAFAKFANAVGLPRAIEDRNRWIRNALNAQPSQTEEQPTQ